MKSKIKRGGKRNGSGRKPIADKKIALTNYIRESVINRLGGKDEARKFVERQLKKVA